MKPLKKFYFSPYEDRVPDPPLPHCPRVEFWWQVLASASIFLGFWYISWRWTSSLNFEALWFSLPVVIAETLSFFGMLLFFYNIWSVGDTPQKAAPEHRSEVVFDGVKRPLSVDVFLPTYTEDPELTRYSIRAAKQLRYKHEVEIKICVLDDGNRKTMKTVADQEKVDYLTRENNLGYKAGNLRNGLQHTSGDFVVILDSDTRIFPSFLENTLGYFRDPDVAWVQTPQWFYDIPKGEGLEISWEKKCGRFGGLIARGLQKCFGPIVLNEDPFISDSKLFYDVILRRRNRVNASFCCGAGSIHRRDAVMEAALRAFSEQVDKRVHQFTAFSKAGNQNDGLKDALAEEYAMLTELTPYKFHVSEDIYTSIVLQSDTEREWKSVLHPTVETKMLSPLDMKSWAMQRLKYAGGTLDIMMNDNPLFRKGMSIPQKLMYAMTFWSYLSPLWLCIFLTAPIIALITGITPVSAYSVEFFMHLLPFLIIHEIASALGTWGIDNRKGKMLNLAFFSFNLKALWSVFRGREIVFHVTPKSRKNGTFLHLVWPQIALLVCCVLAVLYGFVDFLVSPSSQRLSALIVNSFWAMINAYAMTVLISAALWKPEQQNFSEVDVKNRLQFKELK